MPYLSLKSDFLRVIQNSNRNTKLSANEASSKVTRRDFERLDSSAGKMAGPIFEQAQITITLTDKANPSADLVIIVSLTLSPKFIMSPYFFLMPNASNSGAR